MGEVEALLQIQSKLYELESMPASGMKIRGL
jgi:hypothetical protein